MKTLTLKEIDVLVGTELMGFTPIKNENDDVVRLIDEPNECFYFMDDGMEEWFPTIEINHAWEVVEKLRENYFEISIAIGEDIVNVDISTTTDNPKKVYCAYQEEKTPLAICKAALLTQGIEVQVDANEISNDI